MSTLTPEAKSKLAKTIRSLRERLLRDLHDRADSVYRLAVPVAEAGLSEERRIRRQRLEAWIDEQARSNRAKGETLKQAQERHRLAAEKLAAATFLNRLVVVKQLEAYELVKPRVVTGGWDSPAYRELRDFAPDFLKDESEGYGALLRLLFDELALDLPGLFGEVGVSALFEIPTATLRAVVAALDALLAALAAEGVEIVGGPDTEEYGKLAWILDPEGRKIELWEPVEPAHEP